MSLLLARPRFKRHGYVVDESAPRAVAFAVLREIRLEQLRRRSLRDEVPDLRRSLSRQLICLGDVAENVRAAIDRELR